MFTQIKVVKYDIFIMICYKVGSEQSSLYPDCPASTIHFSSMADWWLRASGGRENREREREREREQRAESKKSRSDIATTNTRKRGHIAHSLSCEIILQCSL